MRLAYLLLLLAARGGAADGTCSSTRLHGISFHGNLAGPSHAEDDDG
jgi:hypothetical protein